MYQSLADEHVDMHKKTPDWRGRLLRMLVKDALIALILIVFVEHSLRVFVPATQDFIFTPTLSGGHPIQYNDFGLRDETFSEEKPAGERRILAIGNSTTFGTGVAQEDAYPKHLQRHMGSPFFVVNAGGQGGSLQSAMHFLEDQGFAFEPEMVVLGFQPSMIAKTRLHALSKTKKQNKKKNGKAKQLSTKQKIREAMLKVHGFLYSSYAYVAFDHYVRKGLYKVGVLQDDLSKVRGAEYAYAFDVPGVQIDDIEATYAIFFEDLKRLNAALDARGISMIVMGIPSQFELSGPSFDNPRQYPLDKIRISPLDRVAGYTKQLAIPFVDLRPALSRVADVYIRSDYTHLNSIGLSIAAAQLQAEIQKK